ncbi:hypothetical protein [Streptomyces sp. NPDC056682]|uniref:hypothetical protein n=1 Tax=Streptomyces sp. NPDC056682 TaxID=3345909 RepID=UPI00368C8CE7
MFAGVLGSRGGCDQGVLVKAGRRRHRGQRHPRTLPLAAAYVIAAAGIICRTFVHADCTKRADPADILAALHARS